MWPLKLTSQNDQGLGICCDALYYVLHYTSVVGRYHYSEIHSWPGDSGRRSNFSAIVYAIYVLKYLGTPSMKV